MVFGSIAPFISGWHYWFKDKEEEEREREEKKRVCLATRYGVVGIGKETTGEDKGKYREYSFYYSFNIFSFEPKICVSIFDVSPVFFSEKEAHNFIKKVKSGAEWFSHAKEYYGINIDTLRVVPVNKYENDWDFEAIRLKRNII